jgi:hypothetical protein
MPSKKPNTRAIDKGDLAAARAELKAFRHDVAILKKKGLLDKKYDARSVKPTKYLKSVIRQFGNVLEGKATTAKVSKEKAAYYKGRGYSVKNGRVVVPTMENERVYSTHGNFVRSISGKGGTINIIDLGLNKTDILKWQDDLRNNRFKLKESEQLRFQLNGYNSHIGFSPTRSKTAQERMAEYLENYNMIEEAENGTLSADASRELVEGMVIFKVKRDPLTHRFPIPPERPEEYPINAEIQERRRKRNAERRRARIGRMGEEEYNRYMDEKADLERERRAKLTPEQKAKYKADAKVRAARSRTMKKPK